MKLMHLADLHIGKRAHGRSMLEDQAYALGQIIELAQKIRPDGVLLAGDLYDKSVPSGEAVSLLDDFLCGLIELGAQVFAVSGNHDSPERLSFGSRALAAGGVHIAGDYGGALPCVTLRDAYGPVHIHLLSYLNPARVQRCFPDTPLNGCEAAMRAALESAGIDFSERNVLICHQFMLSNAQMPVLSDSETVSVGGVDGADIALTAGFDYVALGHLHCPQRIGRDEARYAGSPLKYSFSEARHKKSAALVELGRKGQVKIDLLPIKPLRDMIEIRGQIDDLVGAAPDSCDDYVRAVLTNSEPVYDAAGRLRAKYPNLLRIDFERERAPRLRHAAHMDARLNPLSLFEVFYEQMTGNAPDEQDVEIMRDIFREAGEA